MSHPARGPERFISRIDGKASAGESGGLVA